MPKILLLIVALGLAACTTTQPPEPKQPNERHRVPVNQTLPAELHQVIQ